jgi:phosphohistidine swiveling domain-containing protein
LATSQARKTAGQIAWTRDLARDLFPGVTTPFAWTVLCVPAEAALRRALAAFGATSVGVPTPDGPKLWQRDQDGQVCVNATALADSASRFHGAAWLGSIRGEMPTGLLGRLQTGSMIRAAQACITVTLSQVTDLHGRVAKWLAWVRGLRWTQADLLQVMEELEPKARDALQTYFILRAGLSAAATQVTDRLAEWLPERPPDVTWGLYVGLVGMPGAEAAYTLAVAARDETSRDAALACFGHRGPDEMRPDGMRWADHPALLASLAEQRPQRNSDTAHIQRQAVEAWVFGQLDANKSRQFEAALRRAQALCVAADLAWDAVAMVMAAAQRWSEATASEAVSAKLIARPADVLYLELEELKQVATGEWHPGRSAAVQEEVLRRRAQIAALPATESSRQSLPASPGQGHGPAYLASPAAEPPPPAAIWLTDAVDAGCAPFWLGAGAIVTAMPDPWSPGLIVARALGVPAVIGAADAISAARPGQAVAVDGDAGQVSLDTM